MNYVQAIPLYTKEDKDAFAYFHEYQDPLNAITGTPLTIVLPRTILGGDGTDVARAIQQQDRLPGLTTNDLPCLWVEDSTGHFKLPLPPNHDSIVRLIRQLADATRTAPTLHDLERTMNDRQQPSPARPDGVPRTVWIPALCFTSIIIIFLIASFFLTPTLTNDQRSTLQALFAILAGFASSFLTGTALFEFTHTTPGTKMVFSGTAGIAVFALCMIFPPYFFRSASKEPPATDTATLSSTASTTATQGTLPPTSRRTIIIAEYDKETGTPAISLRHRLYDTLTQKVTDAQLQGIRIAMLPTVIPTPEAARAIANRENAAAIIYGYADAQGIATSVLFTERPGTLRPLDMEHATWEPLPVTGVMTMRADAAIDQAAFIGLVVMGELFYLDNRYGEGVRAFDEAMRLKPEALHLKEGALVTFFRARAAQHELPLASPWNLTRDDAVDTKIVKIACAYADAIHQDKQFYWAYNNLGVLLAADVIVNGQYEADIRKPIRDCLARTGREISRADDLFRMALDIQPDLTAIQYNRLSTKWAQSMESGSHALNKEQFANDLRGILANDDSIPGAHVMLAVLAFDNNDIRTAQAEFERAVQIRPDMPGLYSDLGHVYWRNGDLVRAQEAFAHELALRPKDYKALLGKAAVAVAQNDMQTANRTLDELDKLAPHDTTAMLLRALSAADQGHIDQAVTLCEKAARDEIGDTTRAEGEGNFPLLIMAGIQYRAGQANAAVTSVRRIVRIQTEFPVPSWADYKSDCPPKGNSATWEHSACMNNITKDLLGAITADAKRALHHRHFYFADLA